MQRVHVPQGFPKVNTDAAPTAVFLVLFLAGAISNIILFRRNTARGHKFLFNGLCVGFCMARVVTCSLRLAWTCNIEDRDLAIAATIFVAAGVLILFIINLLFAQRILRGLHPHLGWHKAISRTFLVLYALIPLLLAMVITATVQSFFTTDRNIVRMDIDMQRGASSYFLFFAFLPMPITLFALLYPKTSEPDHFGKGAWAHKAAVVLGASAFLCLGAGFRIGTLFISWTTALTQNPPWWNAKWCFYFFNFTVELIVIVMYLVLRIDLLFHVPDGSKGPGSYSRNAKLSETKVGDDNSEIRRLQRASTDRTLHTETEPQSPVGAHVSEKGQV